MREYKVFHMFCGSGGGALGFARGHARVGCLEAGFRTIGGVDVDPMACEDFSRLVGVPATCLDLFSSDQYSAFHGESPPPGWTEATYHDLREAAGWESPDAVFLSPPCKGLSGLLSGRAAAAQRYQALNALVVRGIRLMLDAFGDDPPRLIILENVPRIATRGRDLLDEVIGLLGGAGYSVAESTHDCGELGGLAQHRRRFLMVARHRERVRPYLYEPPRLRVRGAGEVLGDLPLPDAPEAGAMHRCPRLTWQTWVRLALIPPGKDWRALMDIDWQGYAIEGAEGKWGRLTDPTLGGTRHNNVYRLIRWDGPSVAVTSGAGPSSGGVSISDPRPPRDLGSYQPYGVVSWDAASRTVTGQAAPGAGPFSVADPRGGWCGPIAPPRPLPADGDRPDPVPRIVALDGTWHRPLTTLELAALQGYPVTDEGFRLEGRSHSSWRNRIGNSVPPPTAAAIAATMLHTLLLSDAGAGFALSSLPVWVRPIATAISVQSQEVDHESL